MKRSLFNENNFFPNDLLELQAWLKYLNLKSMPIYVLQFQRFFIDPCGCRQAIETQGKQIDVTRT